MFHNWQQILKTILEDGPENTRQQGCCLTVAPSSPFHSRCMLHSAPHWGSGISTHLCFPFFKKKFFMSKRQGLRSASQLWFSELTDQESGIWAKGKMWVVVMGSGHQGFPKYPQSTVWGFGHQCCLYCVLYRTKWWSLLEEVLGEPGSLGHFMSTASVRTEDGHSIFLFSTPPLGPSPSPGWTKYSSSGAMVKPDRGGAPGTHMLTARLPGNMVNYVWIPDDRKRQAFCISSELGTITITPSSSAWILVSLLPRKGSCLVTHSLYHCSFKKIL